jgi:hypothetical protein
MNLQYLFDKILGEFNMERISLQLMDPNCKPVHLHPYIVPRHLLDKIVRFVDIGVLEEDYSSEWPSRIPSLAIPKNGTITVVTDFRKFNLLLKRRMPPISYPKDWAI